MSYNIYRHKNKNEIIVALNFKSWNFFFDTTEENTGTNA